MSGLRRLKKKLNHLLAQQTLCILTSRMQTVLDCYRVYLHSIFITPLYVSYVLNCKYREVNKYD